ncbi:unnamed protein product [Closterium sp. Naga37s-1]|nr:unnamed protein product [Closterium sp. Naga37s-1]
MQPGKQQSAAARRRATWQVGRFGCRGSRWVRWATLLLIPVAYLLTLRIYLRLHPGDATSHVSGAGHHMSLLHLRLNPRGMRALIRGQAADVGRGNGTAAGAGGSGGKAALDALMAEGGAAVKGKAGGAMGAQSAMAQLVAGEGEGNRTGAGGGGGGSGGEELRMWRREWLKEGRARRRGADAMRRRGEGGQQWRGWGGYGPENKAKRGIMSPPLLFYPLSPSPLVPSPAPSTSGHLSGGGSAGVPPDGAHVAAPPALLLPFGAAQAPTPRVAICLVGGAREFHLTAPTLQRHLLPAYPSAHVFLLAPLDHSAHRLSLLAWPHLGAPRLGELGGSGGGAGGAGEGVGEGDGRWGGDFPGYSLVQVSVLPDVPVNETKITDRLLEVVEGSEAQTRQGLMQQFKAVELCVTAITRYEKTHAIRYDWILRTRVDGYWMGPPPPLAVLDPISYTIPGGSDWGGLNDRLGMGGRKASWKALRRLSVLRPLVERGGYSELNAERVYLAQMAFLQVQVRRECKRVKGAGKAECVAAAGGAPGMQQSQSDAGLPGANGVPTGAGKGRLMRGCEAGERAAEAAVWLSGGGTLFTAGRLEQSDWWAGGRGGGRGCVMAFLQKRGKVGEVGGGKVGREGRWAGNEERLWLVVRKSSVVVARYDFPFCILSRKKGLPAFPVAAALSSTSAALNGAKCRPCRPTVVGGQAAKYILALPERIFGAQPHGIDLCRAEDDWAADWREIFDKDAGEVPAAARQYMETRTFDECVDDWRYFHQQVPVWNAPPPVSICVRGLLGKFHKMGYPGGDFPVFLDPWVGARGEARGRKPVVYSAVAGVDYSFDWALMRKLRCRVHAFDSTPEGMRWIGDKIDNLPPASWVHHAWLLAPHDRPLQSATAAAVACDPMVVSSAITMPPSHLTIRASMSPHHHCSWSLPPPQPPFSPCPPPGEEHPVEYAKDPPTPPPLPAVHPQVYPLDIEEHPVEYAVAPPPGMDGSSLPPPIQVEAMTVEGTMKLLNHSIVDILRIGGHVSLHEAIFKAWTHAKRAPPVCQVCTGVGTFEAPPKVSLHEAIFKAWSHQMPPYDMGCDGAPLRKAFSTPKPNRVARSPSPVPQKSVLQAPARPAQPQQPVLQSQGSFGRQQQPPLYVPLQQSGAAAPYKVDGMAELTAAASAPPAVAPGGLPSPKSVFANHPGSPQRNVVESLFKPVAPAVELTRPGSPAGEATTTQLKPFGWNSLFKAAEVGNMVMQQQTAMQVAQMTQQMNHMLAEITALRSTVAELQVQVQCAKAQAQSQAVAQSEARGALKESTQQVKDALQEGLLDVKELISFKDAQQKARLFNSFSTRDRDPMERVPNDAGELPVRFPATRKELTAMSLDTMQYLFEFYQLPKEPQDTLYDRLMKHIGVRV